MISILLVFIASFIKARAFFYRKKCPMTQAAKKQHTELLHFSILLSKEIDRKLSALSRNDAI